MQLNFACLSFNPNDFVRLPVFQPEWFCSLACLSTRMILFARLSLNTNDIVCSPVSLSLSSVGFCSSWMILFARLTLNPNDFVRSPVSQHKWYCLLACLSLSLSSVGFCSSWMILFARLTLNPNDFVHSPVSLSLSSFGFRLLEHTTKALPFYPLLKNLCLMEPWGN
jgi:hypothetical protein